MIDDATILKIERLRDDAEALATRLRREYQARSHISKKVITVESRRISEIWMVDLQARSDLAEIVGVALWGDLGVEFQRLLTYSERSTPRSSYDTALGTILKDFRGKVVVPLKQRRGAGDPAPKVTTSSQSVRGLKSVFIGHSFTPEDAVLVGQLRRLFEAFGLLVRTGERPRAGSVSEKVKKRIAACDGFVGVFAKRERIGTRGNRWTTSTWVIDEKAYALGLTKKLVLLKESGVDSIGGIQGDYEYIEFTRGDTLELVLKVVELLTDVE